MNDFLHKIFKWNINEILMDTAGVILFVVGINLFVEPNNLYSGGVFGLAQLLNNLVKNIFSIDFSVTSFIYFSINIPLFLLAFTKISKSFCYRTLYSIIVQTIALNIIPIPAKPIVNEIIANVMIGGTLVGVGCSLILSSTGSTGGTDIIGIVLTNKFANFSVGKFALIFNFVIFGISGLAYGIPIMVYSIMYSIIENMTIDKLHDQNVCTCVTIFTKEKPKRILSFVSNDLNRGATWWKGTGEGTNTDTYITYLILSRYELHKLEKFIKVNNENVFLVKNDFVGIDGNFSKRLSK